MFHLKKDNIFKIALCIAQLMAFSTTASANSLDLIINDMTLPPDYNSRGPYSSGSVITVSNTEALRAVSRPGRAVNFADTVNSLVPWFWVFANSISASTNTAVQARNGETWL
jgi:hypothetical protein